MKIRFVSTQTSLEVLISVILNGIVLVGEFLKMFYINVKFIIKLLKMH